MSTTGTVALREIRRQVGDLEPDDDDVYRWPTADVVVYMNDVIIHMQSNHPEYFAGTSLPTSPVAKLTEATLPSALPFTDAGLLFFNDMVAAKILMEDGEAAANRQRVQDHIQLASAES